MDLDFGLYWNRRYITLRDIHDVYKQLEIIAKEMQHWRPGIGSSNGLQALAFAWERCFAAALGEPGATLLYVSICAALLD